MKALPQINGNSAKDFTDAGRLLFDAAHDAIDALSATAEPLNGRNYQHLPASDRAEARNRDVARVDAIRAALIDLKALAAEIHTAGAAAGGK